MTQTQPARSPYSLTTKSLHSDAPQPLFRTVLIRSVTRVLAILAVPLVDVALAIAMTDPLTQSAATAPEVGGWCGLSAGLRVELNVPEFRVAGPRT